MVQSLNSNLGLMVEDFSNLKRDHDPRLSSLERNSLKMCKYLNALINLSKDSLETTTEGLVLLNEKAIEWKSLFPDPSK